MTVLHREIVDPESLAVDHPLLEAPRRAYSGFDAWWRRVQDEHRTCHVVSINGDAAGIAVLKPKSPTVVKLCTFCMLPTARGHGSRFLSSLLRELRARGYLRVYGTFLPAHKEVAEFFTRNGFKIHPEGRLAIDL